MYEYETIICWSDEAQAFVAEIPELPGCMAHGASQEEALANAKEAVQLWLGTAKEFGDPIPEPKGRRLISMREPGEVVPSQLLQGYGAVKPRGRPEDWQEVRAEVQEAIAQEVAAEG